jgi:hypothetical protein
MSYDEISVPLKHDAERHWPPVRSEILYASRQNDSAYVVESIPFYAKGVAEGDTAVVRQTSPHPVVTGILQHCGSSCFRIMTDQSDAGEVLPRVAALIEEYGCRTERHPTLPLLAVTVPASVDITIVYSALDRGADAGEWDYEIGFDYVRYWLDHTLSGRPLEFPN